MSEFLYVYQDHLQHYRFDFWNEMSQASGEMEIHLLYNKKDHGLLNVQNSQVRVYKFLFDFRFVLLDNPAFLVLPFDFHILNIYWYLITGKSRNYVLWGIGFSKNTVLNFLRKQIIKRFKSVIVYEEIVCRFWQSKGLMNVYYKGNTVFVPEFSLDVSNKDYFLVCGTLDTRKRIEDFLEIAICQNLKVKIIGLGPAYLNLRRKFESDRIIFLGRITDKNSVAEYYRNAIATVHPGQAGLSVLESLGNGTPFISYIGAVSGGEKYNIINNRTGFRVRDKDALSKLLSSNNIQNRLISMSNICLQYYRSKRTIYLMVDRFIDGVKHEN